MIENLVIVESPAKAKTIEKFLGKNFIVKSSLGHIRDLDKKDLGIDVDKNYLPHYIVPPEKKKVVTELKKFVKEANTIWLASDEDREGEAIAWHLAEVLGLKVEDTKRIVFHEITKNAILEAIENPRKINANLVNAQQARRVLDRLVGFEISPVLWKKVKPQLSAGRVQSVAVRLIVEREREILSFKSESSFKVIATFIVPDENKKNIELKAELQRRFKTNTETIDFLNDCKSSIYKVEDIISKPGKKSPPPPFTTSTLQQEASRKLGYSVTQTMTIAQKLYESGFITYMRTDSVNLSEAAIKATKDAVIELCGEKYSYPRNYKTKTKGAQEAHEAIRPSYMEMKVIEGSSAEQKLYELIWKRTIASQMKDAELEKTIANISISGSEEIFVATGEVLKFDGFLKVYNESTDEEKESSESEKGLLPPLKKNQQLQLDYIDATEKYTHHPARYTEASLVKKLEDLGIGRPSTYAPIISTIQQRGYVLKENRDGTQRNYNYLKLINNEIKKEVKSELTGAEKAKLFPTDMGIVVTDFLIKYFNNIMDYNFTATVEKEFDEIATGKVVWNKMIDRFYQPFHDNIEDTLKKSTRGDGERKLGNDPESGKPLIVRMGKFGPIVQLGETLRDGDKGEKPKFASLRKDQLIETLTLSEALELLIHAKEGRKLGIDPKTGRTVIVRIGKFGPIVQLGEIDGKEKPKYASLKSGQLIETINLQEALDLFNLPRTLGLFEGKMVTAAIGKFGPYLQHDSKFISLKKDDDPLSVILERAIKLIQEKRESDKKKIIKEFDEDKDVVIIKDRWGHPCIYHKKKYYKISSKINASDLTLAECKNVIKESQTEVESKSKSKKGVKSKSKSK